MYDMTQLVNGGGHRYATTKVKLSEIPPAARRILNSVSRVGGFDNPPVDAMIQLAEHYMFGEAKYPNVEEEGVVSTCPNWAAGMYISSMFIESMLRHTYAYMAGERDDVDFGKHHMCAVAWGFSNLIHMFDNYELYEHLDDRKWQGFHVKMYHIPDAVQRGTPISPEPSYSLIKLVCSCINHIETTTTLHDVQGHAAIGLMASLVLMHMDINIDVYHYHTQECELRPLDFTCDVERINDIVTRDYGTPQTVENA